jgi:hypothetical protein
MAKRKRGRIISIFIRKDDGKEEKLPAIPLIGMFLVSRL